MEKYNIAMRVFEAQIRICEDLFNAGRMDARDYEKSLINVSHEIAKLGEIMQQQEANEG